MPPPNYFPFTGQQPYRHRMGLEPLRMEDWIEVDAGAEVQLELRRSLLATKHDVVLQCLPEAEAHCLELHDELRRHLLRQFPAYYGEKDAHFTVALTGRTFAPPGSGPEALEQIGQWIQEDVCLLGPDPPMLLQAGCVCFPSRWSLAEKIGQDSPAIHAPVPGFAQSIGKAAAGFLAKIQVEKPIWRINWAIHDSERLHCPGPEPPRLDLTEETVLDHTFLRLERQTLRRLPRGGAVVFTIKTYLTPMREIAADREKRELLGATLRGLPEELAEYKGMKCFFPLLQRVL